MRQFFATLGLPLAMLWLTTGCGEDGDSNGTPDGNNQAAADSLVELADNQLGLTMNALLSQDSLQLSDLDLGLAHNLYVQAIEADVDHAPANFGAALTEIVMMSQDPDVQDFYDELEATYEFNALPGGGAEGGDAPAFRPLLAGSTFQRPTLPTRLGQSAVPVFLAADLVPMLMSPMLSGGPQPQVPFGEMQDFLESELLPRVDLAVSRLVTASADQDFQFIVTGEMQGDELEDAVELDRTELLGTLAMLSSLQALVNQLLAYDLNLGQVGMDDLQTALTPGSPFLALRSGGAQHMQQALASWRRGADAAQEAVDFLESETDNQNNDLIRLGADDLDQETLNDFKASLVEVHDALNGIVTVEYDADDDGINESSFELNVTNLFATPPADFKTLLPLYTVSLVQVGANCADYHESSEELTQTVEFSQSGHVYREFHVSYDGEGFPQADGYQSGPAVDLSAWENLALQRAQALMQNYSVHTSFYVSAQVQPGSNVLSTQLFTGYCSSDSTQDALQIQWTATSYAAWQFPDPTFSGLISGMSQAELKDRFWGDYREAEWIREMIWRVW